MTEPVFAPDAEPLWRRHDDPHGTLWLAGHLHDRTPAQLLNALTAATDDAALLPLLKGIDGHFALVARLPGRTVAAVDRVRSIPLAFARDADGAWRLAQSGGRLAAALDLTEINPEGALALAMAGYTIGGDTLYAGLSSLVAGEAAVFAPDPRVLRYDVYDAWRVEDRPRDVLRPALAETTLRTLDKLASRAGGRPIVVPLSAGLDSRLVVSGLRHLGYRDVRCFSYGLPGNHEARAAEAIAGKLGYPWRFVRYSPGRMKRFFASDDHAAYLAYADSATSSPFEQDLHAIRVLQADGFIPPEAIIVNGNSGDFISGAHVLKPLRRPRTDLDDAGRRALVVDTLIGKHFRLWQALATAENDARLAARLGRELDALDAPLDADGLHGVYEAMECRDRQSKYVITCQRAYEHAGLDWALPLWDVAYLDFWQRAPLAAKIDQALYRETLIDADWGGVWGPGWWWSRTVSPSWIRGPRLLLKALHVPLGRDRWHAFEKRFLSYWTEMFAGQAVTSYARVATDRRGARHGVAWLTEAYLASKGVAWDGRPMPGGPAA